MLDFIINALDGHSRRQLERIEILERNIMSGITELNAALADLKTDLSDKIDALEAALTAAIAASGADAAGFDAAMATVASMKAVVDAAPVPAAPVPAA